MCQFEVDDPCEVWSESTSRARKQHQCTECHSAIQPGDVYIIHFSVFEGETCSGRICALCEYDRAQFRRAHNGAMYAPPAFEECLEECIAEGDEESDRIWAPMLGRLQTRRREARATA